MGNSTLWSHYYQIRRYEEAAKERSLSLKIWCISIAISVIFQCYFGLVSVKGIVCPKILKITSFKPVWLSSVKHKRKYFSKCGAKNVGPHLLSLYGQKCWESQKKVIIQVFHEYVHVKRHLCFLLTKYEN